MRILTFILLLSISQSAFAQIEESQFIRQMIAHKIGVEVLCDEILKDFPGLRSAYALARCRAHDASKVRQDSKFLEKHGLSKERSIASYLSEIYGRYVPETQLNRGIIDEANRVDNVITKELDALYRPTAAERRLGDMLEHVADLTERGMHEKLFPPANGIYERSQPMKLASRYIAENPVEIKQWSEAERAKMVRIATRLESDSNVKQKLIKSINPVHIERNLLPLETNSHFRIQRQKRAECFEALLHAPLPGV